MAKPTGGMETKGLVKRDEKEKWGPRLTQKTTMAKAGPEVKQRSIRSGTAQQSPPGGVNQEVTRGMWINKGAATGSYLGTHGVQKGEILELGVFQDGDYVGGIMVEVNATYPQGDTGTYVGYMYKGADVETLRAEMEHKFEGGQQPLLFLGANEESQDRKQDPAGRDVFRVEKWRHREKKRIKENWYLPDWTPPLIIEEPTPPGNDGAQVSEDEVEQPNERGQPCQPRSSNAGMTTMDRVAMLKDKLMRLRDSKEHSEPKARKELGKLRKDQAMGSEGKRSRTDIAPTAVARPEEEQRPMRQSRSHIMDDEALTPEEIRQLESKIKKAKRALKEVGRKPKGIESLGQRITEFQQRMDKKRRKQKEKKRKRKSKKSKKKSKKSKHKDDSETSSTSTSSSDSSSSDSSSSNDGIALKQTNPFYRLAEKRPGALLEEGLKAMGSYLQTRQGAGDDTATMEPMVTSYLTSVLLPSNAQMSIRNSGELRNLARALDCILRGNVMGAADTLIQRFKSVETVATGGGWGMAKHLELIPDGRISTLSIKEREAASKLETQELRLKTLQEGRLTRGKPF